MGTTTLSSYSTPKKDLGSKSLVIQTLCMHMLDELLLIMLQLANTDLDSSLRRNLNVTVVHILLKQDVIFSMNVIGLTGTGILGETSWAILLYSW